MVLYYKLINNILSIEYIECIAFKLRLIANDSKAQLNIESNLARHVIIQIPTQSPGRYTTELPLRRIKLFFIPSKFALCANYSHIVDFLGFRQMETAPTSIEVLLRLIPD